VLKGKYRSALFGLFLPFLAIIGAVRLARPKSVWARRRYSPERIAHAARRAADFDRRFGPMLIDWEDFVGGKPSLPNPPAGSAPITGPTATGPAQATGVTASATTPPVQK
jgi:hypothetical protein